ncbi:hypothetical protein AUK10_00235 [Candidatus Gracilibacteria bacterium CG2_30_37_12]|nr:MAG: hypothetical protein AUK10_00235 [Candidatus Gracilibacteria bacterium CG2_30_37_12]
MKVRIFTLLFICFTFLPTIILWAAGEYVGEDLGNNIYKRIDEGSYKLKTQLIENRLKGVTDNKINKLVGKICADKDKNKIDCFRAGVDFTTSELDDIVGGALGPIYTHMVPENNGLNVEQIVRIRGIIVEHYQEIQNSVTYEQKKLQSVGSIGLFSDGNKDNSSYDLMVDLENIHRIIFAKDIAYNGTSNMGASSIANLLNNIYPHPLLPLDTLTSPNYQDPGVSLIAPSTSTGLTLSGIVTNCVTCGNSAQVPANLDQNFLRDVQAQLLVGRNNNSSLAFADDAKLPEYWANIAQGSGSLGDSPGGGGAGTDKFPCSKIDVFCILMSMMDYSQNILGGKTDTIEYILDQNLKIANTFAGSSLVQAKMTNLFFGLSLKDLNLPSMLHIGAVVSSLPPPLLNLKKESGSAGAGGDAGTSSADDGDEFNRTLVCAFEESGLDFKRQNSLEKNDESRMVQNLVHLTTNSVTEKSNTTQTPSKAGCIQAKEMELKKSYGDSFNDDLFELHAFTLAFTHILEKLTGTITALDKIPKSK